MKFSSVGAIGAVLVGALATTATPAAGDVPAFRPLAEAPAGVVYEDTRITRAMSDYAEGSSTVTGSTLGCWNRGVGKLPWRCLSRFAFAAGGHCDIVIAIGPGPILNRRTGRVTYSDDFTAQRFRVVYGPCSV